MSNEIKREMKYMLLYRDITFAKLSRKLNSINNKNVGESSLLHKIGRKTIKYSEVKQIAEILGFEIKFVPKTDWQNWD